MPRDYSLLILGHHRSGLDGVVNSSDFITWAITQEFKRLSHVILYKETLYKDKALLEFPRVDFVLYVGYDDVFSKLDLDKIRERTGCLAIVTLSENGNPKSDWNYVFKDEMCVNGSTLFKSPLVLDIYKNIEKIPLTVLVDHAWPPWKGTELDWTDRILSWSKELGDRYSISQLTSSGFEEYLVNTDTLETFIVTHQESYGFSVLDMIARGIRVLAPEGFLHKEPLVDYLGIPTFKNKEEFFRAIKEPVDKNHWNGLIYRCTGYPAIAGVMDGDFGRWKLGAKR